MLDKIIRNGLIKDHPHFLPDCVQYEVMMGSEAYGASSGGSDIDIYGFCIPPQEVIFPQYRGEIFGFDNFKSTFEEFQIHHVFDPGAKKEYDFVIFSIVKYFFLIKDNNPNIIDSLFVPDRCLFKISPIGQLIRDNRKMFLHKGAWNKFKGYAYSQLSKLRTKKDPTGKRKELVDKFGYDVKFAYHIVRLLNEVEQILVEHDIDLERNREQLKSIRAGEWTQEQLEKYFLAKELELEKIYLSSTLPKSPDLTSMRILLVKCLDMWYDGFELKTSEEDKLRSALHKIKMTLEGVL